MMPREENDLARSFYTGVLGLPEIDKPEGLKASKSIWFQLPDKTEIHVNVEEGFIASPKAHTAFAVEDLEALKQKLTAAGYEVKLDTRLAPIKRFFTKDPFGNRLEFTDKMIK